MKKLIFAAACRAGDLAPLIEALIEQQAPTVAEVSVDFRNKKKIPNRYNPYDSFRPRD